MKVGIIGAGLQGRRRAGALNESGLGQLVVVADPDLASAESLARPWGARAVADWRAVVDDSSVDIVVVCTPSYLHAPISVASIETGKHVLCEKPIGLNVREAELVIEAGRRNQRLLKCGFNLRHHPAIVQARRWYDAGLIGEAMYVHCRYGIGGRPGYDKEWRARPEMSGGGEMMDQGLHGVDLARWFLGDFVEASGMLGTFFWEVAPLEDNAFALLRTAEGKVASLHSSWTQWKNLFLFELYGRDGYIRVEGLGGSYGVERAILGRRDLVAPFREKIVEFHGADQSWVGEWQEFVTAIREGREPTGNGHDGLEAVRVVETVYGTARRVQAVPIARVWQP